MDPLTGSSPHTRGARGVLCLSPGTPGDHPRIRGEHPASAFAVTPPVWIIPAYAGSTLLFISCVRVNEGSSPHTRGARFDAEARRAQDGDHPRIRGEHRYLFVRFGRRRGIIPAYAGSTYAETGAPEDAVGSSPHTRGALLCNAKKRPRPRDHPRIRGEHVHVHAIVAAVGGIIPAYAGSTRAGSQPRCGRQGIIPAYAGSTSQGILISPACDGSSPHTRGARYTIDSKEDIPPDHPRIRGEHAVRVLDSDARRGIIPAYAGSTPDMDVKPRRSMGSSPHTRGALGG